MKRLRDTRTAGCDAGRCGAGRRGKAWKGWLVAVLFSSIAFGLLYLHSRAEAPPFWAVGAISVEGNRSISTADLLDRLCLRPGMPWWKVATRQARDLSAAEPRLADVRVSWRWPRDLLIRVEERESVLRVLAEIPLELAADGMLLEPEERIDPVDLPILTGALPSGLRPGLRLELPGAGEGWRDVMETGIALPTLWKKISQIHYVGGKSFQLFLRDERQVILWEVGVNDDAKISIPAVLADLNRQGIEEAVLDLRFRDQIVVK